MLRRAAREGGVRVQVSSGSGLIQQQVSFGSWNGGARSVTLRCADRFPEAEQEINR